MSYGFYRLPPDATFRDYINKEASRFHGGFVYPDGVPEVTVSPAPSKVDQTSLSDPKKMARALGYSGNICTNCHGARLKRAGHCEVCEDCGTTTGCS